MGVTAFQLHDSLGHSVQNLIGTIRYKTVTSTTTRKIQGYELCSSCKRRAQLAGEEMGRVRKSMEKDNERIRLVWRLFWSEIMQLRATRQLQKVMSDRSVLGGKRPELVRGFLQFSVCPNHDTGELEC